MTVKKLKFSKADRVKIAAVLDAYKAKAVQDVSPSGYSNKFGCGNCGDMGPLYVTLHALKDAFGIKS
jgi:hypothetical protein